jgi:hypothetical protein
LEDLPDAAVIQPASTRNRAARQCHRHANDCDLGSLDHDPVQIASNNNTLGLPNCATAFRSTELPMMMSPFDSPFGALSLTNCSFVVFDKVWINRASLRAAVAT